MVVASFTADVLRGISPLTVQFTVTVDSGDPVSYLWDFGDGTSSTDENPEHVFEHMGLHTIVLKITDADTSVTVVRQNNLIKVARVAFTARPLEGTRPLVVVFSNKSKAPNGMSFRNWEWNFGDDTPVSSERDPVHTYEIAGVFSVTLNAELVSE